MKASRVIHLFTLALLVTSLFGPAGVQRVSAGGGGTIFTVNFAGEGSDAVRGDGACSTTSDGTGPCTLRAAIEEANAILDVNTIYFNLPGSGIRTISLSSPLPAITAQLNLDASSQPLCTVPCVALNGAMAGASAQGLVVWTDNSRVRGFILTSFASYGILIHGNGNMVEKNEIGFRRGSSLPAGNGGGIYIEGSGNVIGGTSAVQRNVISGNDSYGIRVDWDAVTLSSGNVIQGNYVGTNRAGTAALANGIDGIKVANGVVNTLIGGTVTGARNVISGNVWAGIELQGNGTTIQGNFIGTRADETGSIGNAHYGILVLWPSGDNLIGGTTNAARNRITHNRLGGIGMDPGGTGTTAVRRNSIYRNAGLGIDLNNDGVTPNDASDADTGPNGLQNYPSISSAVSSTGVINGALRSGMGGVFTIEFFSSPAGTCDASGHGEGAKYLGSKSVLADSTGLAKFSFASAVTFTAGSVITATATDAAGNTSEFSVCRVAG